MLLIHQFTDWSVVELIAMAIAVLIGVVSLLIGIFEIYNTYQAIHRIDKNTQRKSRN